MTFGSLFSGVGGFDLGLERAGMTCKWQVEIDPYCLKVLNKHWPEVTKFGDIRECGKHNLESVDLICGGFPCQPFSVAGKKRGKADNRYLWPEMLRVISELKPAWVLGENVAGIIELALEQVCLDLESEGYEVQPLIIPACAVNAPHRRDRVWIIAHSQRNRNRLQPEDQRSSRIQQNRSRRQGMGNESGNVDTNDDEERWNDGGCLGKRGQDQGNGERNPAENLEVRQGWINKPCENDSDTPDPRSSESRRLSDVGGQEVSALGGNSHNPLRSGSNEGAISQVSEGENTKSAGSSWDDSWHEVATRFCGVADGIPHRVDRLKCLGNAVVPQIVEIIGRMILAQEEMF